LSEENQRKMKMEENREGAQRNTKGEKKEGGGKNH
jgi:hypothetical protein